MNTKLKNNNEEPSGPAPICALHTEHPVYNQILMGDQTSGTFPQSEQRRDALGALILYLAKDFGGCPLANRVFAEYDQYFTMVNNGDPMEKIHSQLHCAQLWLQELILIQALQMRFKKDANSCKQWCPYHLEPKQ